MDCFFPEVETAVKEIEGSLPFHGKSQSGYDADERPPMRMPETKPALRARRPGPAAPCGVFAAPSKRA